jgi:hypothetical protein
MVSIFFFNFLLTALFPLPFSHLQCSYFVTSPVATVYFTLTQAYQHKTKNAQRYKVCLKTDIKNWESYDWEETGIVVQLQEDISTLQVNGIASVVSVAPQVVLSYSPLMLQSINQICHAR